MDTDRIFNTADPSGIPPEAPGPAGEPAAPTPAPNGGRYAFNPGTPPQRPIQTAAPDAQGGTMLFRLGLFIGLGFLVYLVFRKAFIVLLQTKTPLGALYFGSAEGEILANLLYSYFVVALPFLLVWLILRRQYAIRIPLGAVNHKKNALLLVFVGLAFCFLGDVATNYFAAFADSVGVTFHSYQQALEGDTVPADALGLLLYVVQGALVPALLEEFVFRGVILQPLRRFGDWFAIFTSALLFGLMHGNMTQVPFAIIAGVALGYCATVTGSLWVSVAIHCCNNLFAVGSSILSDRYNDGVTLIFSNVCIYGFLGVGLLALIIYLTRNPAWRRLYPGVYPGTPKKKFFLAPTLLLALVLLACLTLSDIPALTRVFGWI